MSGGWSTIESDAGVFTYLIESLGVVNIQFEELVSLNVESLQELNPIGIIFLFKYQTGRQGKKDKPEDGEYELESNTFDNPDEKPVWFATQTIQNACATQALLNVLLNQPSPNTDSDSEIEGMPVEIGPQLRDFKDFTAGLPVDFRGEALSNSDHIREVHNSFSQATPFVSEETRIATAEDDVYHYVAYTSINSTLYELDGLQPGPIRHGDRGACPRAAFADAMVPVLQRRIARYPPTEIRFNLLAICEDFRVRAAAIGDKQRLRLEADKRAKWRFENALRSHNFVDLAGAALKGLAADKLRKGEFDDWVEKAREATKKKKERGALDLEG